LSKNIDFYGNNKNLKIHNQTGNDSLYFIIQQTKSFKNICFEFIDYNLNSKQYIIQTSTNINKTISPNVKFLNCYVYNRYTIFPLSVGFIDHFEGSFLSNKHGQFEMELYRLNQSKRKIKTSKRLSI
jgi:hypothetical protein